MASITVFFLQKCPRTMWISLDKLPIKSQLLLNLNLSCYPKRFLVGFLVNKAETYLSCWFNNSSVVLNYQAFVPFLLIDFGDARFWCGGFHWMNYLPGLLLGLVNWSMVSYNIDSLFRKLVGPKPSSKIVIISIFGTAEAFHWSGNHNI